MIEDSDNFRLGYAVYESIHGHKFWDNSPEAKQCKNCEQIRAAKAVTPEQGGNK